MKRLCLVLILVGAFAGFELDAKAQDYPTGFDRNYRISSLDPILVIDKPDAVIRLDERRFDVRRRNEAHLTARLAITVLNADGRSYGQFPIGYDKLVRLKKLSGRLIDANGKVIRKLKKDDQEDYLAPTEGTLYADNRVRIATLYHSQYPYTVEFSYELEYNGLMHWPSWSPQRSGLPVELSRYDVIVPAGMPVRYRADGEDLAPDVSSERGRDVYRWELSAQRSFQKHLLATLSAEMALAEEEMLVHVAPAEFEIEQARGTMETWQGFGDWYHMLSEGRDEVPASVRQELLQVVSGISDPIERIQKIYAYFQGETRYVSVQLGLGGWQPFDAAYVAERGYGDCKALTNYLKALLKEAGVPAYPALIRSGIGEREVLPDFPSNQFNHVVLMVPVEADTLWLEATDQTAPFNHLGAGNEDRYALVVKENESRLVRTPRSEASSNRMHRTVSLQLEAQGSGIAELNTMYTGNQQDYMRYALLGASERDRRSWLHEYIDIPSFDIIKADFSKFEGRSTESRISLQLQLSRYASRTGNRLFVPVNLMDRVTYVPPQDQGRTQPVKLRYAYRDETALSIELPEGFTIEAMPSDIERSTPFARYSARFIFDESKQVLRYERSFEFTKRVIEAEHYEAYRAFIAEVVQADRAQVVLVQD